MSFNSVPTADELLADGLVRAVMRADHVEPQELKTLLSDVAGRLARRREIERKAAEYFFATPRLEWRPERAGVNAPALPFPGPIANACVGELCC